MLNFNKLKHISLIISIDKITIIFCSIDNFCIVFEPTLKEKQLLTGKNTRNRKFKMSTSEILTITVLFHMSGFRNFKHFYIFYVQKHLTKEFPETVSYNRFTELMQSNMLALSLYMKTCCLGKCTGISFIDSTPIRVCNKKRIYRNKVFKDIATRGKSTMGWFYGFKLHIIVNDKGYVSKELTALLFDQGLHLVTGIRNNMKNVYDYER